MELIELKRRLRALKKLEAKLRFAGQEPPLGRKLAWEELFGKAGRYSIQRLLAMDKAARKEAEAEFFFRVYALLYQESGTPGWDLYDPAVLARLGLPYDADAQAVQRRFRELAKRAHPDAGGDKDQFIALMRAMEQLRGR